MTNLKVTGEGFVGEKFLAIASVVLTILSTAMLIELTIMQRQHIKEEIAKQEEEKKKRELVNNKAKIIT
jgi:heme exporter protein D